MEYKLKDTASKTAFSYGYLLSKIFPYIKPVLGRAFLNIIIAVPLGLLDGIVALSLIAIIGGAKYLKGEKK